MRSKPSLRQLVISFFLGAVAAFLIGMWVTLGEMHQWDHPLSFLSRWWFDQPSPEHLILRVRKPTEFLVDIRKSPDLCQVASVEIAQENAGILFRYEKESECGGPSIKIGAGSGSSGMIWTDYMIGGVFQERNDRTGQNLEVYVSGEWLKAKRSGRVAETTEGKVQLDAASGQWKRMAE